MMQASQETHFEVALSQPSGSHVGPWLQAAVGQTGLWSRAEACVGGGA